MSEHIPPSWSSDVSAEPLGAPLLVTDQGVAGSGLLMVLGGLIVGIVAAFLGGAIWFGSIVLTENMYTGLAIVVGLLVGLGVFFGSRQRKNLFMALIAAVLTFVTLAVSEYFIVRHFAIQMLAEQGGKGEVPLLLPLADMVDVVKESVSQDPMNLVFWAAACVSAFIIPLTGVKRRR